jgi:hypothetical protein
MLVPFRRENCLKPLWKGFFSGSPPGENAGRTSGEPPLTPMVNQVHEPAAARFVISASSRGSKTCQVRGPSRLGAPDGDRTAETKEVRLFYLAMNHLDSAETFSVDLSF